MNNNTINEELFLAYKETQEEKYLDLLYKSMEPLIDRLSKDASYRFAFYTFTREDYKAEINYAFMEAVKKYKITKGSFTNYFRMIAKHRITKIVTEETKRRVTEIKSLDSRVYTDEDDGMVLSDILSSDSSEKNSLIISENFGYIREKGSKVLNEEEKRILLLRNQGYKCTKIAKLLCSDPRHVRYVLSKAKKKLESIQKN